MRTLAISFFVTVLAAGGVYNLSLASWRGQPSLHVTKESALDLGNVAFGSVTPGEFVIVNAMAEDWVVKDILPSCSCIPTCGEFKLVPAHGEARFRFSKEGHHVGKFSNAIGIDFAHRSQLILTVTGMVKAQNKISQVATGAR